MPRVEQTLAGCLFTRCGIVSEGSGQGAHGSRSGWCMPLHHGCATGISSRPAERARWGRANQFEWCRRTTDLAPRATKETAHAIGRPMAALVAVERHLWLTLSDMKEKDRVFLMDATLAPSGLYGNTVNSDVDRYQEARKQAAAFQRFLPRRPIALGAAGREQPQPRTSSSYREIQRYSVASRAPPQRDRGRQRPKKSRPSAPWSTASASLSSFHPET